MHVFNIDEQHRPASEM